LFRSSIDGDSKYVRAMRLVSGFFASLPNFKLHEHPNAFKVNLTSKWPWFYLRQEQLLLFFQDPTHLATKWRNRLLSSTAQLGVYRDREARSRLVSGLGQSRSVSVSASLGLGQSRSRSVSVSVVSA
jgi:hypothetical protein